MAASLESTHQNRMLSQGITLISPEVGLQVFSDLLSEEFPQIGVLSINWSKFFKQLPVGTKMPLLEAFTSTIELSRKQKSNFMQQLEATPVEERRELLVNYVRKQIANIMGLTRPEEIELRQSLFDLGIDSLMAVELKNHLESNLGQPIRSTVLFDYPSLAELVDYLVQEVLPIEFSNTSAINSNKDEQDEEQIQLLNKTKELSEEDLEKIINEKLDSLI
jgi:myxalamid-type polyketide synthase MxaB